jgi:putative peptidoglycan lipid II flippase
MTDTPKTLVKSFTRYSLGVFLSRISGMCRDVTLSFFFGTGAQIALFMVAYRFANLMRRMLAESPLSSSFIPSFESKRAFSEHEGARFFRDLFVSLSIVVVGIVAASMGGLWLISHLFLKNTTTLEMISLTQVMFPSLLFISLYGLCAAFLQCEKFFFLPAVAPVAFNVMWILASCVGARFGGSQAMEVLSYGVVVAFFMQFAVMMPRVVNLLLKSLSAFDLFKCRVFHSSLRPIVKPFLLGILGVGATQINIALDGIFARFSNIEGPAFLWYAIRIEQVPIALFGVAISAAILPALTRAIHREDAPQVSALLERGVKQTFSLMNFSMFGLFALGYLAITMLFGRGAFHYNSVWETTWCLWAYSLGLIPHGLLLLLVSVYYAHKDFKTPMKGAVFSVIFNIILNAVLVFVFDLGAASIALGTSLTSLFNCLYLRKFLTKEVATALFYVKTGLCGVVAFIVVALLQHQTIFQLEGLPSFTTSLGALSLFSIVYIGLYCLMEKLFRCEEILKLIKSKAFR